MTVKADRGDGIEFPAGLVWLVGAGPGDPDLLTRKAERLIRGATVVFHDALVGRGVLRLIPPATRRVYVGKRSGRHSQDQATIDRLLITAALAGERVVRLKGGDPAIFGRATEELAACRAAGVPVAICPGITAASAAAAGLGRSLTLRGLSRKLVFVTAHTQGDEPLLLDWRSLADPAATLAIYMGKSAADAIARNLIAAGLPPETPSALVQSVSMREERLLVTRLDLLGLAVKTLPGAGPLLILVGEAMSESAGANLHFAARSVHRLSTVGE
ncbi:MAG TPA: uroporphyrinogen-III C-methyltransferase [Novosphingobium sp.]|nr:uroporphyrinogen-III C-methyltransferase [Novosphingobium sp.]